MNTQQLVVEEEIRDTVLADANVTHDGILTKLRSHLLFTSIIEERAVSANDVRDYLKEMDIKTGPWMGALFRTKAWKNTGQVVKSDQRGSHARILWLYLPVPLTEQ